MAQIRVRRKAVTDVARRHISIGVRRRLAATAMPPAVYIPVRRRSVVGRSGIGAARRGPASATRRQVEPLGRWAKPLLAAMILVVVGPIMVTTCARLAAREPAPGVPVPSRPNGPIDVDKVVDGGPAVLTTGPEAELAVGPLAATGVPTEALRPRTPEPPPPAPTRSPDPPTAVPAPVAEQPTVMPARSPAEPTATAIVGAETPNPVTTTPTEPGPKPEEAAEDSGSIPALEPTLGGDPTPPPELARAELDLPTLTTEELVTNLPFGQPVRLAALDGKRVWLTRATVQGRVSDRTVWIGPRVDRRMLVLLPEGALTRSDEQDAAIEAGRIVDVRGVIRGLPAAEEMLDGWGLSGEDRSAVEEGEVYLHVDDVRDFRIVGEP